MAQTVVVTAGTSGGVSSTITIPAGSLYTFVIYASTGGVQPDMTADVSYVTPGGTVGIAYLSVSCPAVQIQGPAQVKITNQASATACGVLQEA